MNDERTPIPDTVSTIPWGQLAPHESALLLTIGRLACDAMRHLIDERRLLERDPARVIDPDPLMIAMDVGAAYLARGKRLNLQALAHYPADQLLRDVLTIQQHIDRRTGAFPSVVALRCASSALILGR